MGKVTTCKACGGKVSKQAKVCPHCGQKNPVKQSSAGWLFFFFGACFIVAAPMFMAAGHRDTPSSRPEPVTAAPAPAPEPTPPKPKTRAEIIREQFDGWDGSHFALKRQLKRSLHNPKSFEHVETRYRDQGETLRVWMTFRGENAFGAVRMNQAEAVCTIAETAATDPVCTVLEVR